jgi:SAM-dependent methyltransferase
MESKAIKPELIERLACPNCGNPALEDAVHQLRCPTCSYCAALEDGVPLFTTPPANLVPSEKIQRGPEIGTPWRQANWRFLNEQIARLDRDAAILDVGAGRGDFAPAFEGRTSVSLDVYPYPEVDIVCDLTQTDPFRPGSFEAVTLMNVMEHIYDTHTLLHTLARLLKPGGILITAIPFMVKIHQAPVDFVRYTHFALSRLGVDHGLALDLLEGYYDPVFFLGEGIGNLRWGVLPTVKGPRRYLARALLAGIQALSNSLGVVLGKGVTSDPLKARSMAPTGYHVVYRKKE